MKRQRMYFLVMYNISPIQQGIQSLHACVEYSNQYAHTEEYHRWANIDKTVILLNGGTSNTNGWNHYSQEQPVGTMEEHMKNLVEAGVKCAAFFEPDLNNSTSAIAFLADERVWDRETYPEPPNFVIDTVMMSPEAKAYLEKERRLKALTEMFGDPRPAFLRVYTERMKLA